MANGGESAQGWSLWWDGVSATSTAIAGVTGFSSPSKESVMVDVTGLESTIVEDFFHVGLGMLPEFEVKFNYKSTSAQHIAIANDAGSGTSRAFVVKNAASPADTICSFSGYITKFNKALESKDAVRATFTVKMSTAPSFTVSS
jgi:hypothetical protein